MPPRPRIEPPTAPTAPSGMLVEQAAPLGSLRAADEARSNGAHLYAPISAAMRADARDALDAVYANIPALCAARRALWNLSGIHQNLENIASRKLEALGVDAHLAAPPWTKGAPGPTDLEADDRRLWQQYETWCRSALGGATL
jgi:hypothetical protein